MTEIKQSKAAQHLLTQPGWSREPARIRAPRRVFGNPPHDASNCCKDAYHQTVRASHESEHARSRL